LHDALKLSALSTDACFESCALLVSGCVSDALQ